MLVYARRSCPAEIRPGWVIGTRLVTVGVTVAMAWPWRTEAAALGIGLGVYAIISAAALLVILGERRWHLHILSGTLMATQIVSELVIISSVVFLSGGVSSPTISLYLMTIISAALFYRLTGTLVVATLASASFLTAVWIGAGYQAASLWSSEGLGALGDLSDEEFFTVFLRLCIFYLCAFAGGYLAERLDSKNAALEHTSEALKIAKLETGDILKHLHSGVLTVDITGSIVFFNRAAEEILGVPEVTVRGRSLREAFNSQYPALVERLETVLKSRKMDIRTELSLRRTDGGVIPVGLSTSVLRGGGGNPTGVIAVFQDLTEAKELEERVRSQDRLAAVGELSAGIAHEIRNPLAAISGSVEVLGKELHLEGESDRLMSLIIRESTRLNRILSDFLLFARMLPTVTGRASVAKVLAEVAELGHRQIDTQSLGAISLRAQKIDEDVFVQMDGDHLKQVLINLVLNAIEACELGSDVPGGAITISVRNSTEIDPGAYPDDIISHPDGAAAIMVSDTGCGIPDGVRERLFEPFVSSKPAGTGLGLAIAKRLVDNAGGHISVETRNAEGTTFTVLLRHCQAKQSPETRESVATASDEQPGGSSSRVLEI